MLDQSEKPDSFFNRLWSGQLADRSAASTTFLSFMLLITLFGAHCLVGSRSWILAAISNGEELVQATVDQDLRYVLDRNIGSHCYVMEVDLQPVGFWVFAIDFGTLQDGSPVFKGKEFIDYDFQSMSQSYRRRNYITAETTTDLKQFHETVKGKVILSLLSRHANGVNKRYAEGFVDGNIRVSGDFVYVSPLKSPADNIVPMFLLDYFCSIAALENNDEGIAFSVIADSIIPISETSFQFGLQEIVVHPGVEFPQSVMDEYPGGHGATIERLPLPYERHDLGQASTIQHSYWNQDHQLVWQRTVDGSKLEVVVRKVSREKIIEDFPEVDQILRSWSSADSQNEKDII
jgi:hypothetical protein